MNLKILYQSGFNGQQVKKESSLCLSFQANQLSPIVGLLFEVNIAEVCSLRRNCLAQNIDLNQIPLVFQYNKRDLPNLIPIETFNRILNPRQAPYIEAEAINGRGVLETLKEIARLTVPVVKAKVLGEEMVIRQPDEFQKLRPAEMLNSRGEAREAKEVPLRKKGERKHEEKNEKKGNLGNQRLNLSSPEMKHLSPLLK
jgi:hypothetical protein